MVGFPEGFSLSGPSRLLRNIPQSDLLVRRLEPIHGFQCGPAHDHLAHFRADCLESAVSVDRDVEGGFRNPDRLCRRFPRNPGRLAGMDPECGKFPG